MSDTNLRLCRGCGSRIDHDFHGDGLHTGCDWQMRKEPYTR